MSGPNTRLQAANLSNLPQAANRGGRVNAGRGETAGRGGRGGQRAPTAAGQSGPDGETTGQNAAGHAAINLTAAQLAQLGIAGQNVESSLSTVDFLKLASNFPSFTGENGEQPEDYLAKFNKMAKFTQLTPKQLLDLVPLKLESLADTWFAGIQSTPEWSAIVESENPFQAFSVAFVKRFSIGERNQLARDKLRSLQWRGSVEKLAHLIQKTAANTNISEHEQFDYFVNLLPDNMSQHVRLTCVAHGKQSLADAIGFAVNYSASDKSGKSRNASSGGGASLSKGNGKSKFAGRSSFYYKKKITAAAAPGVKTTDTKVYGIKPSFGGSKCWHCNQPGHVKSKCPLLNPAKKQVHFGVMDVDSEKSK
jgi:hypothetical protein